MKIALLTLIAAAIAAAPMALIAFLRPRRPLRFGKPRKQPIGALYVDGRKVADVIDVSFDLGSLTVSEPIPEYTRSVTIPLTFEPQPPAPRLVKEPSVIDDGLWPWERP